MGIDIGGGTINTAPYLQEVNANRAFALQLMQMQNQQSMAANNSAIRANAQANAQQAGQDTARGQSDQQQAGIARQAALQQMQQIQQQNEMAQQQSFHSDALKQHSSDQQQQQSQFDDKQTQQQQMQQEQINARKAQDQLKYQTLADNAQARLQALTQKAQEVADAKQQAAMDAQTHQRELMATKLGRDDLLSEIPAFVQARYAAIKSGQQPGYADDTDDGDAPMTDAQRAAAQQSAPQPVTSDTPQQTSPDAGPDAATADDGADGQAGVAGQRGPVNVDAELAKTYAQNRQDALDLKQAEEDRRKQSALDAQSHRKFEETQSTEIQQRLKDGAAAKVAAKEQPTQEYLAGIDNELASASGQEKFVAAAHLAKLNKALPDGFNVVGNPNYNPILAQEVAALDAEEMSKAKMSLQVNPDHPYTPDPGTKLWRQNVIKMHSDETKGVDLRKVRSKLNDVYTGKATTTSDTPPDSDAKDAADDAMAATKLAQFQATQQATPALLPSTAATMLQTTVPAASGGASDAALMNALPLKRGATPAAPGAKPVATAAQPVQIQSKQDYDKLPPGAPFIYNGKLSYKGK